jgi:hypothetical protein
MDVFRHILVLDTSILATCFMKRREWYLVIPLVVMNLADRNHGGDILGGFSTTIRHLGGKTTYKLLCTIGWQLLPPLQIN